MLPHARWQSATPQDHFAIDQQLQRKSFFAKDHCNHLVHSRLQDFDLALHWAEMVCIDLN